MKRSRGKSAGEEGGVAGALAAYPAPLRARLQALRKLIIDTASRTEGVGALEEALKWGQPSFLTPVTGSGSTIRIDAVKGEPDRYAMYFHCQTNLVETFRRLYPNDFAFEGNRALVFDASKPVPEEPLRHCIALALTYHQRKR
ncbi:MAG TPA: DUF1801 domain-containing protein [Rhizomicrobium sp.]|jgi:hypothetical protein